jgi:hypothetical protein
MAEYVPEPSPPVNSVDELRSYLERELMQISRAFRETTTLELRPVYNEPARRVEGMIVFADGTEWDPGGGQGVYVYAGGVWVKL